MNKKIKKRLGVGERVYFVNAADAKLDVRRSLELVDIVTSLDRVAWTARTGYGQLIEGRLKTQHDIPFIAGASFCLSIPLTLHTRDKSFAPDFIFFVPGSFRCVSDASEL